MLLIAPPAACADAASSKMVGVSSGGGSDGILPPSRPASRALSQLLPAASVSLHANFEQSFERRLALSQLHPSSRPTFHETVTSILSLDLIHFS